jgi:hypothetical protein
VEKESKQNHDSSLSLYLLSRAQQNKEKEHCFFNQNIKWIRQNGLRETSPNESNKRMAQY